MLKCGWKQTWVMGVTCGDLHVLEFNIKGHLRSIVTWLIPNDGSYANIWL